MKGNLIADLRRVFALTLSSKALVVFSSINRIWSRTLTEQRYCGCLLGIHLECLSEDDFREDTTSYCYYLPNGKRHGLEYIYYTNNSDYASDSDSDSDSNSSSGNEDFLDTIRSWKFGFRDGPEYTYGIAGYCTNITPYCRDLRDGLEVDYLRDGTIRMTTQWVAGQKWDLNLSISQMEKCLALNII